MSIHGLVGGAQVFSSASGGKVYPYNSISTAPLTVVPANPSRTKLTFHNPGSIDIFVAPLFTATGAALAPSTGALGGTFRVFANGGALTVDGECQGAWQAFSASGAGNPLTVMDSNVS